jgi:hypothetical protein
MALAKASMSALLITSILKFESNTKISNQDSKCSKKRSSDHSSIKMCSSFFGGIVAPAESFEILALPSRMNKKTGQGNKSLP